MRPALRGLVAVVLPAAVLAGWWGAVRDAPRDGAVPARVEALDARLDAADPVAVALLGNSTSFYGIDDPALAEGLGVTGHLARLSMPASRSPTWLAVLRNRLIRAEHRADLLLLVAPPSHLLSPEDNPEARRRLRDQLGPGDDDLRARALGETPWTAALARSRARGEAAVDAAQDLALRLWDADASPAILRGALGRVFDLEGGTDVALHQRILPVGAPSEGVAQDGEVLVDLDDTFLPELVEEAEAAGLRLVVVGFPLPPSNGAPRPSPARMRAMLDRLGAHGAGWLDLTRLPIPPSAWFDTVHLNEAGRAQFTRALVDGLRALDALGDGPLPKPLLPLLPTRTTRIGDPAPPPPPGEATAEGGCGWSLAAPALADWSDDAQLRRFGRAGGSPLAVAVDGRPLRAHAGVDPEGCDDRVLHVGDRFRASLSAPPSGEDAWRLSWAVPPERDTLLLPGQALTLDFDEAWDPSVRGPFGVEVRALGLGASPEGVAVLTAGGVERTLPLTRRGRRLVGAADWPAPAGDWSLRVAPVDGGLEVESVTVGEGRGTVAVLRRDLAPRRPEPLLGTRRPGVRIAVPDGAPDRAWAGPLTAFEGPEALVPVARGVVAGLDGLTPDRIEDASAQPCSALALWEDGRRLGPPHAPHLTVLREGGGAWRQVGDAVLFTSSDGTDPRTNGRRYTVGLDPARRCRGALWIHPGDTVAVKAQPAGPLPEGATHLQLAGVALTGGAGPGGARLTVELTADGRSRLTRRVPVGRLDGEVLTVPLDTPLTPDTRQATLRLALSDGAPSILLTGAGWARPVGRAPGGAAAGGGGVIPLDGVAEDPGAATWTFRTADRGVATAEIVEGPTGEDALRLRVDAADRPERVCAAARPAGAEVAVDARWRVGRLERGEKPWMDAALELAWFAGDEVLRDADGVIRFEALSLGDAGDWTGARWTLEAPEGADGVRPCLAFRRARGVVTLSHLRLSGPGGR